MSKATTKGFIQHHFLGAKSGAGFTIIELLVVIAIIGLISSVVLVSMKGPTGKAKIAKSLEFSQTILNTTGYDAVGMWSFDEGSGPTAFDKSGYGNHGTRHGATWVEGEDNTPHWYVNEGQGRSALEFDGNDWIDCGDGTSLNLGTAFTFEAWINPKTISGNHQILNKESSYERAIISGTLRWAIMTAGGWEWHNTTLSIAANKWTHVACSYSSPTVTCYKNGGSAVSLDDPQGGDIDDNSNTLNIGRRPSGSYFDGLIDEVRIYESALGSSEIQQHYADGAEKHQLAIK